MSENNKEGLAVARKRIQECIDQQKVFLDLRNCGLIDFSNLTSIFKCTHLKTINFKHNKIQNISILENLKNLREVFIINSIIQDINSLKKLKYLNRLDIRSSQITDISFLYNLQSLNRLNLFNNNISNIDVISNLRSLEILDLSFNKIYNISALSNLKQLKYLYLENNTIKDITFLKELKKLIELQLSYNEIEKIPKDILYLNCLPTVNNNPLLSPPIEIVIQGKQSMLDWYAATKKHLNEIKVILIGDPKAGKTSLLRQLKEGDFKEDEVQTDGVNIEDIHFGKSYTFTKQKSIHHLTGHFWDFGGQEIMSATHNFFLTNRSVYVLVLDARKDKQVSSTIRKEVKRIKATGGNSPIIIVANQIDINAGFGFENEYELQEEFPQIKYFLKTSCKTGEKVEALKEKLEELILSAELLNTEIDEKWISIKEQFREELPEENFLDADRFIEICNEFKLTKESSQHNALEFLHDLGLVLHFKEIKGQEYYVLNPYWITYGVYQILTSKKAGELKGEIPFSELEYIINEEEDKEKAYESDDFKRITYTPSQRKFLVQVLHQFKLCFILPSQESFIIPDLLSTNEPSEITKPIRDDQDCIRFVYEYDFLPRTIMPIILVETYQFHKARWRTGCVLEYEKCQGFISQYDNKLSIIVVGEHRSKREFLAIIRSCINEINKKLSNPPKMLIPLPNNEEYVPYKLLLGREKRNEKSYYHYDTKKDEEVTYNIGILLEGIANEDEVHKKLDVLLHRTKKILDIQEQHYQYLIQLPTNKDLKETLESSIQELSVTQTKAIAEDLMLYIGSALELQQEEIEDTFKEIYQELSKTDNIGVKLKLATPLIGVLGVGLEGKFDIKNWSQTMYKKHEWIMFKLLYESR
ncbi:COR domain-containing protein [Dokdonia sp.]|uniref:COR domain-containing protein n=1 Tax=Dokdonia sp. TaxID=2024995 RepID=UPI00326637C9